MSKDMKEHAVVACLSTPKAMCTRILELGFFYLSASFKRVGANN
jgi:hypothetical protein